jgi:hypothetical protein
MRADAPGRQALKIALDADLHEAAGRAYSSLQEGGICLHRLDEAGRYYPRGGWRTARNVSSACSFSTCLTGGRVNALLLTGRWNEAAEISAGMLRRPGISPVNRLNR